MEKYILKSPSLEDVNYWSMNDSMTAEHLVTMQLIASSKNLDKIRENTKEKNLEVPTYTALVLKAIAEVIRLHPEVNRAIIGPPFFKKIVQFNHFNINVAIEKDLPNIPGQAYSAPIENVDQKSAVEISRELRRVSECTIENDKGYASYIRILKYVPYPLAKFLIDMPRFSPKMWSQYRGGACWLNAPTKAGADFVFTSWSWPVSFSFGCVKKRPFVVNDQVIAESTIPLLMVFDRRLMGGGPAGRIFADYKKIIEEGDPKIFW